MPEIRCPKCSAISSEGLMGFPRCHRCHENLRQCLYCRHFAVEETRCTQPVAAAAYQAEGERAERCEYFLSRYGLDLEPASPLYRPLRVTYWMLILTALVVALLAAAHSYLQPEPYTPHSVFLQLTLNSQPIRADLASPVEVETPLLLRLLIYNTDPRAISRPVLRFRQEVFGCLPWESITPRPLRIYDEEPFRYFVLPPLPPDSSRVVTFVLRPRKEGAFPIRLELLNDGGVLSASPSFTVRVQGLANATPTRLPERPLSPPPPW